MNKHPHGVSDEVVEAVVHGYMESRNSAGKYPLTNVSNALEIATVRKHMPAAIQALLASGEVVLKTDHEAEMEKVRESVAEMEKVRESVAEVGDAKSSDCPEYCNEHRTCVQNRKVEELGHIDKLLRGNVCDPDPLEPMTWGALSIPTTYGLAAGIVRERDVLKQALSNFTTNHATTGEK